MAVVLGRRAASPSRHVTPTRARRELERLIAAEDPSGLIGHTVLRGPPVALARPEIVCHHTEVERRRDLDGCGLIGMIQADESGLGASSQFDPVWGRRA